MTMETEYQMIPGGLPLELSVLSIDEVLGHLANHLSHFLLDPTVCVVYINRLAGDGAIGSHEAGLKTLAYLAEKYVRLEPFDPGGLELWARLGRNPEAADLAGYLAKCNPNNAWERKIEQLQNRGDADAAINILRRMLPDNHGNLRLADKLLGLLLSRGRVPDPELAEIKVSPKHLLRWKRRLFTAYAAVNAVAEALALWERIKDAVRDEVAMNLAAEIQVKAGQTQEAMRLYAVSLARDPLQDPARRRLNELANPTAPDRSLLASTKLNIYLYSFNKAEMLGETLQSLAACEIGGARIKVLLNGCTDDSLAVVERARSFFPENPFQILPLQVNVGAPSARNWLIAEPETREADQTVFLDDDVYIQPDFLHHFLTAAASRPKCGVVGCKIVFPGIPAKYQYLYRNVSVAKTGVLRISLDVPNGQYDNNLYDFNRETATVMGCCHMLSRQALADVPTFDLCFSPTQMDDIAHDFDLALLGYRIVYCGLVSCVHRQLTGNQRVASFTARKFGNLLGNDVKFYYRFRDTIQELGALDRP